MFVSYFVFLAGRSLYFSADLSKEATNFLAANREHCCRNMKPFGFLTTTKHDKKFEFRSICHMSVRLKTHSSLSCLSCPVCLPFCHISTLISLKSGQSYEIECKLWYILSIVSNVVKILVKIIEIWSKTHRTKKRPLTTVPNVHCTYIIIHL